MMDKLPFSYLPHICNDMGKGGDEPNSSSEVSLPIEEEVGACVLLRNQVFGREGYIELFFFFDTHTKVCRCLVACHNIRGKLKNDNKATHKHPSFQSKTPLSHNVNDLFPTYYRFLVGRRAELYTSYIGGVCRYTRFVQK